VIIKAPIATTQTFSIPSTGTMHKSCILPGGMVEAEWDKMLEVQVLVKQEVVLLVQAVLPPDCENLF
jgi:hypothetical protein